MSTLFGNTAFNSGADFFFNFSNPIICSKFTMPTPGGTVTELLAICQGWSGGGTGWTAAATHGKLCLFSGSGALLFCESSFHTLTATSAVPSVWLDTGANALSVFIAGGATFFMGVWTNLDTVVDLTTAGNDNSVDGKTWFVNGPGWSDASANPGSFSAATATTAPEAMNVELYYTPGGVAHRYHSGAWSGGVQVSRRASGAWSGAQNVQRRLSGAWSTAQ